VALDHRALHRMVAAEVFHREQGLAVQRRDEGGAGIHRVELQRAVHQFTDHHRAGAAVALGAAFLGAGAAGILAQPVQHAAGGIDAVDGHHVTAVVEVDRTRRRMHHDLKGTPSRSD
jgi:hypothetical protein